MVTLSIDGGKKHKIRAGDILGALTGEAGIESTAIGKIDITDFHSYVAIARADVNKALVQLQNGKIKGNASIGIEQGSTDGLRQIVKLADGQIEIPTGFVEFVWRYPKHPSQPKPALWNDFFTGFIAQHANNVIESLYY